MKHNSDVPGQLALFAIAPTSEIKLAAHDPYWDEIVQESSFAPEQDQRWNPDDFGEVPYKLDANGQLTIFYDDSLEPPDPGDYLNLDDYEQAWQQWDVLVREQVLNVTNNATVKPCVREQVTRDTLKTAPEHENRTQHQVLIKKPTHWVERYWVERSGNKYWYYRYTWMSGRKMHHVHIGSVRSPIATEKREAVEIAIANGKLPLAIKDLIRGWKND